MIKQHIYSALVLTALLSAGCTKEIENTLDGSDSSAIELSSVSTDPTTKAVITGTEFTTDEAAAGIGLFLLDGTGATYGSNEVNVKYTFSSSKWTAASPLRVGGTSGKLYGYYPYSGTATDITAIPVASSINGTDYLFAAPVEVTAATAKNVSLSLSHSLARVRLSFKLDGSYSRSGALSEISLWGDCVAASGKLNAKTGGIDATASKFTASTAQTLSKTAFTTIECLVVPASIESGTPELKIACTIDGQACATSFTGSLATLASGRQTTIELTVSNSVISVSGVSVDPWGNEGIKELQLSDTQNS